MTSRIRRAAIATARDLRFVPHLFAAVFVIVTLGLLTLWHPPFGMLLVALIGVLGLFALNLKGR